MRLSPDGFGCSGIFLIGDMLYQIAGLTMEQIAYCINARYADHLIIAQVLDGSITKYVLFLHFVCCISLVFQLFQNIKFES